MGQIIIIIIHTYLCFPTRPPTLVCNPKPDHLYILYVDWGILQHCLQWANKYISLMPTAFGPHTIIFIINIVCPTKFFFNIPNCFCLNVSSYSLPRVLSLALAFFAVLRCCCCCCWWRHWQTMPVLNTIYYVAVLIFIRWTYHRTRAHRLEHGFGPSRQLIMNNRFTF